MRVIAIALVLLVLAGSVSLFVAAPAADAVSCTFKIKKGRITQRCPYELPNYCRQPEHRTDRVCVIHPS